MQIRFWLAQFLSLFLFPFHELFLNPLIRGGRWAWLSGCGCSEARVGRAGRKLWVRNSRRSNPKENQYKVAHALAAERVVDARGRHVGVTWASRFRQKLTENQ